MWSRVRRYVLDGNVGSNVYSQTCLQHGLDQNKREDSNFLCSCHFESCFHYKYICNMILIKSDESKDGSFFVVAISNRMFIHDAWSALFCITVRFATTFICCYQNDIAPISDLNIRFKHVTVQRLVITIFFCLSKRRCEKIGIKPLITKYNVITNYNPVCFDFVNIGLQTHLDWTKTMQRRVALSCPTNFNVQRTLLIDSHATIEIAICCWL